MANKIAISAIAFALSSSSIVVLSPPVIAAPIKSLECHRLREARDQNLCFGAKVNIFQKNLATYYCKKLYGPRAIATGSIVYRCDLRTVVDHR
jgi:hypothetical protein